MSIVLNTKQTETLDMFTEEFEMYIKNKNKGVVYQIDGPAGTGKTELTRLIIERLGNDYKLVICAPTHKARQILEDRLKVLKRADITISTCHQFLQAKLAYTRSGKHKWFFNTKTVELPDLLILDEVSMIDDSLFQELEYLVKNKNLFILTFGDSCQLPPVNEDKTKFYLQYPIQNSLTQNMRNSNTEYNLFLSKIRSLIVENLEVYTLRQLIELCKKHVDLYSLQTFPNIRKIPRDIIEDYITEYKTQNVIMLAHRTNNKTNTVKNLNEYLRESLFPNTKEKFEVGDKLIFTDYFKTVNNVYHTNDIVFVHSCSKQVNTFFDKTFSVYKLGVNVDHIYFIGYEDSAQFDNYNKYIKDSIKNSEELILAECSCSSNMCNHKKQIDTLWQEYHQQYKNINSPIDYAYCLSIHKSQGSTYDKVYLFLSDFVWFLSKGDISNFFKLFYVGVSRTKTTTVMF